MPFNIIDSGRHSAAWNMQKDCELLDSLDSTPSLTFHLYDWEAPSATFGHFSNPMDFLSSSSVAEYGLQLARRPTGGGVIFHEFDFAFSILISAAHPWFSSNTLANYEVINRRVAASIKEFLSTHPPLQLFKPATETSKPSRPSFCMAQLTPYDVALGGKKIAGAAQRRTKKGILHQGSICLTLPPDPFLDTIFLPHINLAEAIKNTSLPLLKNPSEKDVIEAKKSLSAILIRNICC